ncbi:MAG: DUF424 domain-containing protein [Candidatus Baldrarchaeia archaeon]
MRVYLKVRRVQKEVVVAVCDENLLGKKFKEGRLRLHVKEDFYGGQLVSIKEGVDAIKEATIANIVGENIIRKLIEEGLIIEEAVIKIAGIPHVQIIKMI